jgi:hypothetical protein
MMVDLKVMAYFKLSLSTHNWDRAFLLGSIRRIGIAMWPTLFIRLARVESSTMMPSLVSVGSNVGSKQIKALSIK